MRPGPGKRFDYFPEATAGGTPEWAITFADMMTLLLTFFILMASYSNLDAVKYRALVGSLKQAFGTREPGGTDPAEAGVAPSEVAERNRAAREALESLAALARESGPAGPLSLHAVPDGMRLRVEGRMLFPVAEAELTAEAGPLLSRLAPILARYPYRIWVEGHTDNVPIQNTVYPSNWELSAARAGTVVRALATHGGVPASRLVAVGYADTNPVAPNTGDAERARNRRVEFLLSRIPAGN